LWGSKWGLPSPVKLKYFHVTKLNFKVSFIAFVIIYIFSNCYFQIFSIWTCMIKMWFFRPFRRFMRPKYTGLVCMNMSYSFLLIRIIWILILSKNLCFSIALKRCMLWVFYCICCKTLGTFWHMYFSDSKIIFSVIKWL
jgi:hypothetical protein